MRAFVADSARVLLGFSPEIFPVSARLALKAKQRFAGRMKNPIAAITEAMTIPVMSAAAVDAARFTIVPSPRAPAPAAAVAATALRAFSAIVCASRRES